MSEMVALLLLSAIRVAVAVRCSQCRYLPLDSGETCFEPCEGRACFLFHDAAGYILQGCLNGVLPRIEMGCRLNAEGASLCFCREELCNTPDVVLRTSIPFPMPKLRCQKYMEFPGSRQTDSTHCESSVCGYQRNLSPLAKDQTGKPHKVVGCLQDAKFAFDLDPFLSRAAGLLSAVDRCYVTQLGVSEKTLHCSCSRADLCNARGQLFPVLVPKPVRCRMAHNRPLDADKGVVSAETCEGQFCLIQRIRAFPSSNITFYNKGCYSGSHADELRAGYTSAAVVEQWLCADELCNIDVISAQLSIIRFEEMEKNNLMYLRNVVYEDAVERNSGLSTLGCGILMLLFSFLAVIDW